MKTLVRLTRTLALILATILTVHSSISQILPQPPPDSPEVHPDKTVTFRLRMPNAQKVELSLEGSPAMPMAKGDQDIWSVTTAVLEPNLYGYTFVVDGTRFLDPENPRYKSNVMYANSLLEVPGDTPQPWDQSDIPHGELHQHFYYSSVVGENRDYFVYTPPGFDPKAKTHYPVLYLLHGFSDDAGGWSFVGKANLILDTLIAQGKAKPMIIVMPLGYGVTDYASHHSLSFSDRELTQQNLDKFRLNLLTEILPQVEKSYPVSANKKDRAIAGLSMGGSESLYTGLNNLDKFGWIGSFSMGGLTSGTAKGDYIRIFPGLKAKDAAQLNLLWIACGTEDRLLPANKELIAWLITQGIKPTVIETPGAHTWMVWRHNLINFAPLLFK